MTRVIRHFLVLYVFVVLSFCMPLSAYSAVSSSPIPLDSWIYPALTKLSGLNLIDSALASSRPYNRLEAARQVSEALANVERVPPLPVIMELLSHLQFELADSLSELHGGSIASGYLKPVRQLDVDYIYRYGADSTIAGNGIEARQYALTYNNAGIEYGTGSNVQLRLLGDARIGSILQLNWEPLLLSSGDDSFDLRFQQARISAALGSFELSVGRQSLWWGPGTHGALVLTNNAQPLDMIRLNNPSPILLPWFLEYLGPFHLDVFWSRLEKQRVVPEPYFAGMRINFKPVPWIEMGASRAVMFGGKGRPKVDWNEFLTILGGKNLVGDKDTSNSVAAIDLRLRFPFLAGAEIYGEYGGEDEAGHFLAATAWLAGVYLPRADPSGRLSLRVEYADLSKIDNLAPPWYRHGTYRSGYTYEGRVMGHHVGGAAKDLSIDAELLLSRDLRLKLGVDFETRGSDQQVQEKHLESSAQVSWQLNKTVKLEILCQVDRIDNVDYVNGKKKNNYRSQVGLSFHW